MLLKMITSNAIVVKFVFEDALNLFATASKTELTLIAFFIFVVHLHACLTLRRSS